MNKTSWWRDAVIYQIYPRSFADGNGNGYGDLPGIIAHADHIAALGVDAVWLSPFYRSPMRDAGYDVSDYKAVDPLFGDLADAERMIDAFHRRGLKVIVDVVPNHTSSQHEWFQAALAAAPGSPERAFYHFRDGRGEHGELPPNNWTSIFGGPAWSRLQTSDGSPEQWYLHLFETTQPDLNWDNEAVRAGFDEILRFWLDRGVDGFRVDVAHSLVKAPGLPDDDAEQRLLSGEAGPMWDQDGVHEVYRRWRRVLDGYEGERILVAEAWVGNPERLARYLRPDEMHTAFNFDFLNCLWDADEYRRTITASLVADEAVGAPTTWVLSNHDTMRHVSRLGCAENPGKHNDRFLGPDDPQPDNELGLRRARAATLLQLALPGSAYLYQGEELGLPDHTMLPHEFRQDPAYEQSGHQNIGRDGCRIPLPWVADAPALGFSDSGASWLPQPDAYRGLATDQQRGVADSTLELYRSALRLRRQYALGAGEVTWEDRGEGVLAFRNRRVHVAVNIAGEPLELPSDAQVLLASRPFGGTLERDSAVWWVFL